MTPFALSHVSNSDRERFYRMVTETESGCHVWNGGCYKSGYGSFSFGTIKSVRAHRMAWLLAYGEIYSDMHVLHKCDNPRCVNVGHLYLGNHKENMRDRKERGGEWDFGIGNTQYPFSLIEDIRKARVDGKHSIRDLSQMFGMSSSHIHRCLRLASRQTH